MILVDAVHAGSLLVELRATGRTVPELPDGLRPASLDEAYAIQDELHRQSGTTTGVLKVGCTGEPAQIALGIAEPIAGRVPEGSVHCSSAAIDRAVFHHDPLIECEFALRVGTDINEPGDIGPVEQARLLADAAAPAIELVDTRFTDIFGASGPSIVADNSGAAAIVLGPEVEPAPDQLSSVEVELQADGHRLAVGSGAAVLGDPYLSLHWALHHELARGRRVAAGTWVMTGTCTPLIPIVVGQSVRARFEGLGEVEVMVTP